MATEPKKLGKYNIVGKIGKGAMGEVYKGHDPALNRYVAIKTIAETLGADQDLIERFRREARNAAQLNHPNIITIYEFVEEDGNLYMVMELLEGQDLKDLIKGGTPLTMDQILAIMEQVTDGLGFAHDKGMVHRDLKPANIHISKSGQVKILDFGLVHEASSDMTKTGHVMGTPNYMSPEQVQGLRVDPRSDIFSLGAVFYELLTRKKPFSADSIHATMFKVVQGDREALDRYTHLPKPLIATIDQALDPNPDARFVDGNALREHLRVIRGRVLSSVEADSTMTSISDATIATPPGTGSSPSTPSVSVKSAPSRPNLGGSSASGSRGTLRRRDVSIPAQSIGATSTPSRPIAVYAVAGLLVLGAVGAGLFYLTSNRGGESAAAANVEELNQELLQSKQELMLRSLEQNDYQAALTQAEKILAEVPDHAEALRVRDEAQTALAEIDARVSEARAALERGDTATAADALSRVLALDPTHPLGTELSAQLNEHFQTRAGTARDEMERARSAAASAGATGRNEFQQADRVRQEASSDFNRGEYTNAASKFMEARGLFEQSRTAHEQAQAQQHAQAERQAQAQAQANAALEARLKNAEAGWNGARQTPQSAGLTQQPSYRRAMAEEQVAKRLQSTGDLDGASQAYQNAVGFLEQAQRELAEAQSRQREAEQRRAEATPSPTTAPPTSSAPSVAQEEAAIRQTIANYERAIESKDLTLFRRVKPNLTADEEKRLQASFEAVDSNNVDIAIESVNIESDSAVVTVTRRDRIVIGGRAQNDHTRQQVFTLSKSTGNWVIENIGD
jgi:serine/threonine protein kinase/tetratricopeptide (TPR) repeat protein